MKKTNGESAKLDSSILMVPGNYTRKPTDYEQRYTSEANDLKILMFGDSFSTSLIKFLKESFGESVFIWHYRFNKQLIIDEKPDIVINEIVERNLGYYQNPDN